MVFREPLKLILEWIIQTHYSNCFNCFIEKIRLKQTIHSRIEYYSLPSCQQTHLTLQVPCLFSFFLSISCYFSLATHSSSPTRLMSLHPLFTFPISPTYLLSNLFSCSSEMRWEQAVREVCGVCTCWGVSLGEVVGEIKERENLCETQKERGFVPAAGKHTEHCVWEREEDFTEIVSVWTSQRWGIRMFDHLCVCVFVWKNWGKYQSKNEWKKHFISFLHRQRLVSCLDVYCVHRQMCLRPVSLSTCKQCIFISAACGKMCVCVYI